jgi:hypothetical protein
MAQFSLVVKDSLKWFQSSPQARRGFCNTCGASLFWQLEGDDSISFGAGCLDGPTGLTIASHWYKEDAGDYYPLPDGLSPDTQA